MSGQPRYPHQFVEQLEQAHQNGTGLTETGLSMPENWVAGRTVRIAVPNKAALVATLETVGTGEAAAPVEVLALWWEAAPVRAAGPGGSASMRGCS